jgi:hypothetical protein
VAHRVLRLQPHPPRRLPLLPARELAADTNQTCLEVDLGPGEAEQLRQAHPAVERGREQRPVGGQADGEQPRDLLVGQDAPLGPRPLACQVPERIVGEVAAPQTEREDPPERGRADPSGGSDPWDVGRGRARARAARRQARRGRGRCASSTGGAAYARLRRAVGDRAALAQRPALAYGGSPTAGAPAWSTSAPAFSPQMRDLSNVLV